MITSDVFAHSASGLTRGFRSLGEVIALNKGRGAGGRRIMRRWTRSPSHRNVLLRPDFDRLGVAATNGNFGGRQATAWVARLGARRAAPHSG